MTIYYKAFSRDMKCRDMEYKEGGVYEMEDQYLGVTTKPIMCQRGFHFMKDLVLCLEYYPVSNDITENFYAEVEILGDVVWEEPTKHKGCTNKLKITRVIPDKEVKRMVDPRNNSGSLNSGNSNSGDGNSGDGNSGYWNSGDSNSGDSNSGDGNSGYWNSGDSNSGDSNSGDGNSGYWNSCNCETGAFNNKQSKKIRVFNKKCDRDIWDDVYKPRFLFFDVDKTIGYKASFQKSWDNADVNDRIKVKELPNFDTYVFFEISGIRVE